MRKRVPDTKGATAMAPASPALKGRARNVEMFKDWYAGMPVVALATKYNISTKRAHFIKKRDGWEKLAADITERHYTRLAFQHKRMAAKITEALGIDIDRIIKKLADDKVSLTSEERTHMRTLLESLTKSNRLSDNKPSEIAQTSGEIKHKVLLPPGVKRWGVIPRDPKVEHVEAEEVKKQEPGLSIEDVDSD